MRNGDYMPTRMGAEYDSVTTMCTCKIAQNPENTVGLISFSSKGCVRTPYPESHVRGAAERRRCYH